MPNIDCKKCGIEYSKCPCYAVPPIEPPFSKPRTGKSLLVQRLRNKNSKLRKRIADNERLLIELKAYNAMLLESLNDYECACVAFKHGYFGITPPYTCPKCRVNKENANAIKEYEKSVELRMAFKVGDTLAGQVVELENLKPLAAWAKKHGHSLNCHLRKNMGNPNLAGGCDCGWSKAHYHSGLTTKQHEELADYGSR